MEDCILFDTSRLAKIVANPDNKLSYKVEREWFKDTIVSLIEFVNNSGSMRGTKELLLPYVLIFCRSKTLEMLD